MSVINRPRIEAYIGASGSGKGVSITRRLDELKPGRLLIYDPRDEYGKHAEQVKNLGDLAARIVKAKGEGFRLRYTPGPSMKLDKAFGVVCSLAFAAKNCTLVAEELSDVTTASLAPPAWRVCITQGRHHGLHVIGAAQRPALIDKTFLGNCTYIRCFTLRYRDDRATMAKAMDVPETDITALTTTERPGGVVISYLERDFREGWTAPGEIKLRRRA